MEIIDVLTGQDTRAGSSLKSVTNDVAACRVLNHENYESNLVLVDCPGFDDTTKGDKYTLETISSWLSKTYGILSSFATKLTQIYLRRFKKKITLSGIIYVHRITDIRMSGTAHRNLRMFGELCGDKSAKNVVIVTTMWDNARNKEEASKREDSLKDRYWNVLLHHQASVARFYNDQDSAWKIIDQVAGLDRTAVLLQEEMVTLGRNLNETNAGKALYRDLQGLLEKQNKTMHLLAEKAEGAQTPEDVDAEMNKLREEIDTLLKEVEGMQVPFGRRLALFLGKVLGRKAQAVIQCRSHLLVRHNSWIFLGRLAY